MHVGRLDPEQSLISPVHSHLQRRCWTHMVEREEKELGRGERAGPHLGWVLISPRWTLIPCEDVLSVAEKTRQLQ